MTTAKKPRGFAAMHPDHVKAISRKGGKAAHTAGTAHEFTSEEARAAGAKGGKATHAKRRAAKLAAPATVSGAKDPNRDVRVACSSAAGCAGIVKAKDAGGDYVGEVPSKKQIKAAAPTSDDIAAADGSSADENPDEMGSCGTGGCGSH